MAANSVRSTRIRLEMAMILKLNEEVGSGWILLRRSSTNCRCLRNDCKGDALKILTDSLGVPFPARLANVANAANAAFAMFQRQLLRS